MITTYWNYNADRNELSIYSRDADNKVLITILDIDFRMAHQLGAAIDKIYEQGAENARAEMWRRICGAVGKKGDA